MTSRTIMHIDLDAFYVAVELLHRPELRGRPVIVGGDPDGRGVAATASYEARRFGVHSGMPLRTARRLCPDAVFLRGDFPEYERVSERFHAILRDYSPLVEPGGLDEAYLDLTGCGPIVEARGRLPADAAHSPDALAHLAGEVIRRDVREQLGLAASVGIAGGRCVAKVASDAAKPDGLLVVPAGEEAAFLAPRPLADLPGLGPKGQQELGRMGVRTLGQLAALPDAALRARFGRWGPLLGERARGIDPTPVGAGRDAAKSVSREGTYATDVSDPTVLRASLRAYAESVGAELRQHHRRARVVALKLRYDDFTTITRQRTLERPSYSDEEIYQTGAELLAQALRQDGRAVRLIGLGAAGLSDDAVQLDLFERSQPHHEALLHAIDGLRAKYGERCLETGQTRFDPFAGEGERRLARRTGLSSQIGLDAPRQE